MSAWLKLPAKPGSNQNYGAVSNASNFNQGQELGIWDSTGPTGKQQWIMATPYAEVQDSQWENWVHVALVYNGNNNREFYLNGVLTGTPQARNASNRTDLYGDLWIGTTLANTGGEWLGGIDEVHIFSFEAGAFDIGDVYQTIPEPATMSLLVIGGIAALIRRKRS
ncbi:MAG: LamG-like jellyroll fold domain-containing protein [Phycisphaerae bacterium]